MYQMQRQRCGAQTRLTWTPDMQTLRGEESGQRPRIMVHHASLRKRELPVHYTDYSVARPKKYQSKGSAGDIMTNGQIVAFVVFLVVFFVMFMED